MVYVCLPAGCMSHVEVAGAAGTQDAKRADGTGKSELMNSKLRNLCIVALVAGLLSGCSAVAGSRSTSISPTSVAFGGVTISSTAQKAVTITNTGTGPLLIQSVSLSGSNGFTFTGWSGKTQLRPSGSLQLTVDFSPTSIASFSGVLNVQTNGGYSQDIPLSGSGVSSTSGTPTLTISISPSTASLQPSQSKQFTATVGGTTNAGVTWLVNNIVGGNSTVGTISTTGLYTAPAVSTNTTFTVTARSVADTTQAASATVTVSPAPASVSVAVSPTTVALQTGVTQQFAATVSGTTNTSVAWSVDGKAGGNSSVGTISSAGLYTAPSVSSTTTETVTATSVADSTKSGSATATVSPTATAVTVAVSPTSATVAGGASQQFAATVSGTSNTAVNWFVNDVAGGSTTYGNISQSGLYTAPPCPSTGNVTVTAVSAYDPAAKANSTVALTNPATPSTDYYVATTGNDGNDGSACKPWATIQHAANSVSAGKTVHVQAGVYNEAVVSSQSGTAAASIRFVSEPRWSAQVVSSATNTWYNSGDYVSIEGFDVSGGAESGIKNQGRYVHVWYNKVHDIAVGSCPSGGAILDGNYTSSVQYLYDDYSNNIVYNVGIWPPNPSSCNQIHGIYVGHGSQTVSNNIIFHIADRGIQLWHDATHDTIVNNTIFDVGDGITVGSGSSTGFLDDYTVVANNIVLNAYRWGIQSESSAYIGTHNIYPNNLVFNSGVANWVNVSSTPGWVSSNPQFVNFTGDINGDYHLQSTSPAIDAGINTYCPSSDFDGTTRPQNSLCDIGAYEYKP